ncbi:hypothetical protein HDV00_005438 [Rhizophlyctis rosea]|nr:hypothetical protein HDV00_005438 [Rhizophlyctis rosea]
MPGPIYSSIQDKLTAALEPSQLEIVDDSAKHAGHAAMKGLAKGETHFRVTVVSNKFEGKVSEAIDQNAFIKTLNVTRLNSSIRSVKYSGIK